MNKQIRTYEDLLNEKQRLEVLVQAQKQLIYYDIQEIKEKLAPFTNTLEVIKKFVTKDKTNLLLTIGSDLAINAVVKNFILSRAGWLTKTIIPFFLKNYSSHFVAEQKDKWFDKLKSWLGQKNGKEHKEDSYVGKDDE
jgi:hypothetical protein